jgi:eukaryotic-like serine/threonine-protein kinase
VIALATRSTRIKRAVIVGAMAFLSLVAAGAVVLMNDAREQARRAEAATAEAQKETARALDAERTVTQQLAQIKAEQAAKEKAQAEALQKGHEVEMTKEQLQAALVQAEAERTHAEEESKKARDAAAKAMAAAASEKKTREEAERLYTQEKAHAEQLEREGKKIIKGDLK